MTTFSVRYDDLPFLQTSQTGNHPNRLNWKCEILLTRNREVIENKRILDLASHDGRFSYACLKLGAKHVTGVEARSDLVKKADENMKRLGFSSQHFTFVNDDLFNFLPGIEFKQFDTVLCFGFFYHTTRQMELLKEINRASPEHFILDTWLAGVLCPPFPEAGQNTLNQWRLFVKLGLEKLMKIQKTPALIFTTENPQREGATIDSTGVIARPTQAFIEMVFTTQHYKFRQLKWDKKEIKDWTWLEDYKLGKRVSYLVSLR